MTDFLALPVITPRYANLIHDALRIASRFRLPAIYDAQYVALAQYVGCDLWTDDHKLIRAVQHELPFVRALSD
jgi:predicted nucleic acid-binding protein